MIEVDGEFHSDSRFDEFLMFDEAKLDAVVDLLAPVLDAQRLRPRKTTEHEVEAFVRTLGVVVANALVAEGEGVYYSRRYETYSGETPYRPPWLGSKRLLKVIDGLGEAGLVDAATGHWAGAFVKGVRSSFVGLPELTEELKALGIEPEAVHRDHLNAPTIILKGENGRLIRYDPADELISGQISELRAYNIFNAAHSISCPEWKGKSRLTGLTRTYNEGSWGRGGRHFGGFWQRIPSNLRSGLLIDGKQTVEFDYGGFNTRALYHLTGQELEGDDPYDIPEIRNLFNGVGIDWEVEGRKAVKRIINIAIGAKSKNALFTNKALKNIGIDELLVRKCVPLIIDHHQPIKDHIFKGKSLELMKLESDICHDIIIAGMDEGIIILPVFDSFLTTEDNAYYLRFQMEEKYKNKLGYMPAIH